MPQLAATPASEAAVREARAAAIQGALRAIGDDGP